MAINITRNNNHYVINLLRDYSIQILILTFHTGQK